MNFAKPRGIFEFDPMESFPLTSLRPFPHGSGVHAVLNAPAPAGHPWRHA